MIITSDHGGYAGVQPPHNASSSSQHSLVEVELSGAMLFSDRHLAHRRTAFGAATRYALGCTINASASVLSICFRQTEDKYRFPAVLHCYR